MEQTEIATSQLEKFLPQLSTITKEWNTEPAFIAKLVNGYFKMRDEQRQISACVETPTSQDEYYLQLGLMKL